MKQLNRNFVLYTTHGASPPCVVESLAQVVQRRALELHHLQRAEADLSDRIRRTYNAIPSEDPSSHQLNPTPKDADPFK
jgi:hypothetical protein